MSPFTNNGTFGTPFGWGGDRERSSHYPSMSQQQNLPIIGNPSRNYLHGISESHQESYTVSDFPPNTSSWSNNTLPDLSYSVYGGDTWPSDQHFDETLPGSLFSVPGSSAAGSEMSYFMGTQVAAPLAEQAIPVPPRALPTFQRCPPPPPTRTQAPGPPWLSAPPMYYPVHAVGQHSDSNSPRTGHEVPFFQPATSSVATGHSATSFCQTGLHPITISNSAQFAAPIDPVHVSPSSSRLRGERWDPPNAAMFQCMWINRGMPCSAWIAGDRRSVTSHLRDKHNFTCDGQAMACAWPGCMTWMQRRNIPRHIVACHFAVKVTCSECGMALSRPDAKNKHRLACTGVRTSAGRETTVEDEGGCF